MKKLLIGGLLSILACTSFGQFSNTWSVKFSEAIRTRYTPTINAMTGKNWEYSNTIILHGMEKVYNQVNDANYLNYIKAFIDTYLNSNGTLKGTVSLVSLDRIHPGISCLFLYEKLKSNSSDSIKYRTAATILRNVLVGSSASYNPYRTPVHKVFWHKQSGYDNIMMLDGMYMAHPFLAKYGSLFNDDAAMDTAINQTLFAYYQLYSSSLHLIKHAWKEPGSSGSVAWDDASGNSTSVWSRAMGWYMMALVDILKYVPASHPRRSELLTALSNLAIGIKNYQDPGTGLWYQVVDKGTSLSGNYLETSGSAMFVYALKTGINYGWLSSATYLTTVDNGWTGLQTKIDNYSDGKPRINDFAPAMSVQSNEAAYVQGSLQPVDCPVASGTQHPHGYAAILMAASVMEFSFTTLPVKFISFTAKKYSSRITLTWDNADESEVDRYEVQKSVDGTNYASIGSVPSTGSIHYTFDDNNPESRTVYYRIKAVTKDGTFYYSSVLPVRQKNGSNSLQVFPNPADAGDVNILLTGMEKGKYTLRVFNSSGMLVEKKDINLDGSASAVIKVSLQGNTPAGLYHILMEGNAIKINRSLIIK